MAADHSDNWISAFEGDILRSAFRKSVVERCIAEREWRMQATLLARELTELDDIDEDIVDWIVRK